MNHNVYTLYTHTSICSCNHISTYLKEMYYRYGNIHISVYTYVDLSVYVYDLHIFLNHFHVKWNYLTLMCVKNVFDDIFPNDGNIDNIFLPICSSVQWNTSPFKTHVRCSRKWSNTFFPTSLVQLSLIFKVPLITDGS